MNDDLDDDVFARRLAAALREERGEPVPDVTDAVLARAAAGDEGVPRQIGPAARMRWLAVAAVFLLGVLTVLGVALLQRGAGSDGLRDEAQGAAVRIVTRASDVATLPPELRAVEVHNFDDAALAALAARCPQLERLCVFAGTATARPASRRDQAVSITDAALASIGSLVHLQQLELVGTGHVKGTRLPELERLPRLARLTLSMFDLDDDSLQVLPRLPSLQALDLEANQGFGERGLAAIGRCAALRELSLAGVGPLQDEWFAALDGLRVLERLDLRSVGLTRRLLFPKGFPEPRVPRFGERGIGEAAIRSWPSLRTLVLANNLHLPASVGARIAQMCPRLRELDLRTCLEVDDRTVADVLAIGTLRRLRLDAHEPVTAAVLPALQRSRLEFVELGESTWLTLAMAEELLRRGKEVAGSRRDDAGFAGRLQALVARHAAELPTRRAPEQVRSLSDLDALPESVTRLELRGLGDRAAPRLARLAALRSVSCVRDDEDPFTGTALAAIAALPQLEQLELNNLPRLAPDALAVLRAATKLRTLRVVGVAVDDAGLQALPDLPALATVELKAVKTFTRDGMRALARCRALRELTVTDATQLDADAFAELAALPQLTVLDLGGNPGLLDRSVMSLRGLTALRQLVLSGGQFSSMALQALAGMRELELLDVTGNANLVSSALLHVPTSVRVLRLGHCTGLDADAATLLRDRFPQLTEIVLTDNPWVTDDVLRTLAAAPALQRVSVVRCQQLTNASFATIRDARGWRFVGVTGTACMSQAQQDELAQLRPELEVVRFVW